MNVLRCCSILLTCLFIGEAAINALEWDENLAHFYREAQRKFEEREAAFGNHVIPGVSPIQQKQVVSTITQASRTSTQFFTSLITVTPSRSMPTMYSTSTRTVRTCPARTIVPKTVAILVVVSTTTPGRFTPSTTITMSSTLVRSILFPATTDTSFLRITNSQSSTSFPGVLYTCNQNDALSSLSSLEALLLFLVAINCL